MSMTSASSEAMSRDDSHKFGTFGGVFTPSILTILGVVLFMSAGGVIGQAGIISSVIILVIAQSITLLTGASIAAISTNSDVKGGGAYFLISRSLGPESGGAIGLTLFLAQALSVPFYILGFTEALTLAFPSMNAHFDWVAYGTTGVLLLINLLGASWAIRAQYVILGALVFAVMIFLGGALSHFSVARFQENLSSSYSAVGGQEMGFWAAFAIYFPAVTGIMTGVNMSGDLKTPSQSIPRGTFAAIAVGFLVYLSEILICGGAQSRGQLKGSFYETLLDQSLFGLTLVVIIGVFAASISSALGSLMGAPRILQALSRDNIFRFLNPFGQGVGPGDEPRRGLLLTSGITALVLWWAIAQRAAGGTTLNLVGTILTMFFLYAYGMTNIAAFAESVSRNPSFRPRFKLFHWSTALLGTIGCLFAAILIQWQAALLAVAVIAGLFVYVKQRVLSTTYGDVRRGFYYSRVRENLFKLNNQPPHPKNWRPNTLILSGNPHSRRTLTQYALWLESHRGVATLVEVITGPFHEGLRRREAAQRRLQDFIESHRFKAFADVCVTEDFDQGVLGLIQNHALGPIKPNLLMLGWPSASDRAGSIFKLMQVAQELSISSVILHDKGLPPEDLKVVKRVDIWWRGRGNGSLMLILAYLLCKNLEWTKHHVRVLRALSPNEDTEEARADLKSLLFESRIRGEACIVEAGARFKDTLIEHSHDATVVFLGLWVGELGEDFQAQDTHQHYSELLNDLPTTMLISNAGEADLLI